MPLLCFCDLLRVALRLHIVLMIALEWNGLVSWAKKGITEAGKPSPCYFLMTGKEVNTVVWQASSDSAFCRPYGGA